MKFKLEISDKEAEKLNVKSVKEVRKVYTLEDAKKYFEAESGHCMRAFKCNNPEEYFKFQKSNLLRDLNADKLYTADPDGSITAWECNYYTSIFTLEELMEIVNILGFPVIGNGIISTEME
jgi:hypothetical protein